MAEAGMAEARTAWKGLQTERKIVYISCDQVERMIQARLGRMAAWQPDAVAAIARGGLIPATMIACALGLQLFPLGFDRRHGRPRWIGPAPAARRVLVVDDSCSTGATLRLARDLAGRGGAETATFAIVHDPDLADPAPDFSTPIRDLFRLPWERGEATPAARAAIAAHAADPAHEAPFHAIALDALDLPGMAGALHALASTGLDRVVAVTARPHTERQAVQAMLTACGHATLPLECHPAEIGGEPATPATGDPAASAAHKAAVATRWGCTHFVDADPEQAIRVAALAPHLVVHWWSVGERRARVLGVAQ